MTTVNILESIRNLKKKPVLIFSSTNKVYGDVNDVKTKMKHIDIILKVKNF